MVLNVLNLAMVLAAVQGVLLAVLVLGKFGRLFANRFLGGMLITYSVLLVYLLLGDLGVIEHHPGALLILIGLGFTVSPMHFLYARHMAFKQARFTWRDSVHLTPFAAYELFAVVTFFLLHNPGLAFFPIYPEKGLPPGFSLFNWVILIQISVYMALSVGILNRYARYIRDVFSSIDKIKLDWLRNITWLFIGVVLVFFIENLLLLCNVRMSHNFNLSCSLVSLYVFSLGYMGLFKSDVFTLPKIAEPMAQLPTLSFQSELDEKKSVGEPEKYEKSGLSQEKAAACLQDLLAMMEQKKPYTNPDLTLNQLAEMLLVSPHNLSEILNTRLNQNFFDFINRYRIEAVKRDLADPAKKHLKLLSIALDAGFNSKSSFNAIFKKHTNTTPSEFRRSAPVS